MKLVADSSLACAVGADRFWAVADVGWRSICPVFKAISTSGRGALLSNVFGRINAGRFTTRSSRSDVLVVAFPVPARGRAADSSQRLDFLKGAPTYNDRLSLQHAHADAVEPGGGENILATKLDGLDHIAIAVANVERSAA
jgi:hypothetical protein